MCWFLNKVCQFRVRFESSKDQFIKAMYVTAIDANLMYHLLLHSHLFMHNKKNVEVALSRKNILRNALIIQIQFGGTKMKKQHYSKVRIHFHASMCSHLEL